MGKKIKRTKPSFDKDDLELHQKSVRSKKPSFKEEAKLWGKGYNVVIGVDEVGRGAFAGPVVVGAVVFGDKLIPCTGCKFGQINDSKLLNHHNRVLLSKEIKKHALYWNIATVSVSTINKKGIGKATEMGFRKVINNTLKALFYNRHSGERSDSRIPTDGKRFWSSQNDGPIEGNQHSKLFLLVDGFYIRYIKGIGLKNQKAIIKGDQKSISIAAASIIAKVHRDNLMRKLHKKFKIYNFAKNKGYGTKEHRLAIKNYGLSKIHRLTFALEKFVTASK